MSATAAAPWLIVSGDFSLAGGMDKANYHLAWYLAERRGVSVELVAHTVAEPLASHPCVRIHTVARPLGRHFLGEPLLRRAGRRVARSLTISRPDARVVVNGGNCSWPAVNWVHLVHRASAPADEHAPWLVRLRHRLTRRIYLRQERKAFLHSPLLLANSQRTRSDLIEGWGVSADRVRVVYLGCDPDRYYPIASPERAAARKSLAISEGQMILLFVGALGYDRRKGFDTLLAASRQLRSRSFPEFTILAAGSGAVDYWAREADRLGLTDRVRFLGHVEFIPTLLAAADILVSPTRYEPYGLNVHEALCRRLPAIVSKCAGVAERYPPDLADLLFDNPDDPDELAGRLVGWLGRRERYEPSLERVGAELRCAAGTTWRKRLLTWSSNITMVFGRPPAPPKDDNVHGYPRAHTDR